MRAFVFLLFLLVSARIVQGEPVSPGNQTIGKKTTARQHAPDSVLASQLRCHFQATGSNAAAPERRVFNSQLARFYAARSYRPVWTERANVAELIEAIGESENDGLIPDDYHIKEIRSFFFSPPRTPELQAKYDLLLSDALLSLAYHLRFGKVDPESLDPNWNLDGTARRTALEYRLQNALAAGRPKAALDELRPTNSGYADLKKGLARYRVIAGAGGWQKVPEGDPFREGVRDRRVPLLRKRLQQSGDLPGGVADSSNVYTVAMANAVKRFQKRNGLAVDGVAGTATIGEINIPAAERVDQIRLNLERYRWFVNDLEPTYVLVNIAGFTLQYIENGRYRWGTRVIVGQPYRETPVFKADMQYIVFNPQWVIPPTILAKDALPAIRNSRSYLDRKKLRVIDSRGRVVDPASVNWSGYSAANFPYRLQQTAGDHGALGRIKFMMPNKHIIYLHDTPTKNLFDKSERTFSSGCIRVENPLDLAQLVLQDSVKWNRKSIDSTIAAGKTSTVNLPKRIPVFLLYLTAIAEGEEIQFRRDVYNRDDRLRKALDSPVPQYRIQSCGL